MVTFSVVLAVPTRQRCVEVPPLVIAGARPTAAGRLTQTVGVVDSPVQGDERLGIVEFRSRLLEFALVRLKGGIERRVLLDVFEEVRVKPRLLAQRLVALLVGLRAQGLVW